VENLRGGLSAAFLYSPNSTAMPKPAATSFGVLFDVDGVLVDSYDAHLRSWQLLGEEFGFAMSEETFAATFGRTTREILAGLLNDDPPSPQRIGQMDDRKEALYRQLVAADFPAMPGARELIDALADDGFRLGVGSSGPPENVELALDGLGRREKFCSIVTGRDVTRGKPDPQVFLLGAERMGIAPQRCAVIEDAPAGIAAARAASMASIALVSKGHRREEFAAADCIVEKLDELIPKGIREIIER